MKSTYIAIFFAATALVWAPPVSADVLVGSVDASVLVTQSSKPTLSGMVFGATKVRALVYPAGSTKALYESPTLAVHNDRWEVMVSKTLTSGIYTVEVVTADTSRVIVSEVLIVGVAAASVVSPTSAGSLVVASIPLLGGGVVSPGATVPISYLQITNTSKNPTTLKGFGVKQNGTARTQSVVGLTVSDDQGVVRGVVGGFEGATLFVGQDAFAPADVVFEPGQMRLFTIKATLSRSAYLGTLMLDVASVSVETTVKGPFPIRGTTWTIQ